MPTLHNMGNLLVQQTCTMYVGQEDEMKAYLINMLWVNGIQGSNLCASVWHTPMDDQTKTLIHTKESTSAKIYYIS